MEVQSRATTLQGHSPVQRPNSMHAIHRMPASPRLTRQVHNVQAEARLGGAAGRGPQRTQQGAHSVLLEAAGA